MSPTAGDADQAAKQCHGPAVGDLPMAFQAMQDEYCLVIGIKAGPQRQSTEKGCPGSCPPWKDHGGLEVDGTAWSDLEWTHKLACMLWANPCMLPCSLMLVLCPLEI